MPADQAALGLAVQNVIENMLALLHGKVQVPAGQNQRGVGRNPWRHEQERTRPV